MKATTTIHTRFSIGLAIATFVFLASMIPPAALAQDDAPAASEGYEGGRGLITLEGPSGMFINPTSGTLPKKAATAQYCVFFPDNETDVVGHGLFAGYGVRDDIEVGAIGNYVDIDKGSSLSAGGPYARWRILKDEGQAPQVTLGGYSRLGEDALDKLGAFLAAYKRIPLSEDGAVRSVGVHVGMKQLWLGKDFSDDDIFSAYGGVEVQFPLRLYLVGEAQTQDTDTQTNVPYAVGVQWRAPGIAMSIAGIQNGSTDDVSFYYGIGAAHQW